MIKHKNIQNKMKKTEALTDHPVIARHVPETVWYSSENLMPMLDRHNVIYIKPNTGYKGNLVIRVQKVSKSECKISHNNTSINIELTDLSPELENIMATRKRYIIQQGIDLATYNSCPFDMRLLMQKPYSTWELNLTSAKVALREDAVVTNVSKGAKDYPLNEILQVYDQKQDPMVTLKDLVDFAHQTACILGARFPFRIIGFDMAVDKKGKLWFIEANTQPLCKQLKKVNDEASQEKYEKAKHIIDTLAKEDESVDNPAQI